MLNRPFFEDQVKRIGNTLAQVPKPAFSKFFNRRILIILLLVLLTGGGITALIKTDIPGNKTKASLAYPENTQKPQIQSAKATVTVNKEFIFAVKDEAGKEVEKIKYLVEDAEKRDEILVKGQKAAAIEGRTFLILNLKLTNAGNQNIQINTRDYLRLSVNGNSELLAPDIHNDPVEVQAISTKYTKVGFPILDSDKNLKLQIGEVQKDKTTVELNLP